MSVFLICTFIAMSQLTLESEKQFAVLSRVLDGENPPEKSLWRSKKKVAPGQFPLHYSPGIPLRINIKKPKKNEAFVLIKKRKVTYKNYYYLSKKNDLKQSAKNLYSLLRKIKKDGHKMIAVEKIPNKGIGKTINDRLSRASKY